MGHKWKNLDEAFGDLEQQVTEVTRGVITVLWRAILERTPQYSGQMVHSWTYSIGAPVAVDRPVFESLKGGPSWEGYKPNIAVAEGYNRGADRLFKLGDRVYLTNGAPYADEVNSGEIDLRPANAAFGVERAMDLVKGRYGMGVSRQQAAKLRLVRVGE